MLSVLLGTTGTVDVDYILEFLSKFNKYSFAAKNELIM